MHSNPQTKFWGNILVLACFFCLSVRPSVCLSHVWGHAFVYVLMCTWIFSENVYTHYSPPVIFKLIDKFFFKLFYNFSGMLFLFFFLELFVNIRKFSETCMVFLAFLSDFSYPSFFWI